MAMRQQQQIDTQQQMLAAKEQRLRFLKTQESRAVVTVGETERLHRLRERVEAQESKLRRLRALRGQVDLQKTYNVTLGNDLDSIRALFSEKEKELTLAVAKVEALTRQLEDLRRNRRGGIGSHGFTTHNTNNGVISPAAKELEKLRLELQVRYSESTIISLLLFAFTINENFTCYSIVINFHFNKMLVLICKGSCCSNVKWSYIPLTNG